MGLVCECGRPKKPRHESCDQCRFLDGKTPPEANVIWALRSIDGYASVRDLMTITGYQDETVRRVVRRLAKKGRLVASTLDRGHRGAWVEVEAYCLRGRLRGVSGTSTGDDVLGNGAASRHSTEAIRYEAF